MAERWIDLNALDRAELAEVVRDEVSRAAEKIGVYVGNEIGRRVIDALGLRGWEVLGPGTARGVRNAVTFYAAFAASRLPRELSRIKASVPRFKLLRSGGGS